MARVLVVDDERSIRWTLGQFLRGEGHEVVEVENAELAQKELHEKPFDVVVTDIILPRVTGVELLRMIQAVAPEVPVIMMTGEPTVESAQESLRAGAVDYLAKPIGKASIVKVVANALHIKTLNDAKSRLEAENRAYTERLEQLVTERTAALQAELTERRRVEQVLRYSEERYRGLVETAFGWVWELDAQGRYTFVSPQVRHILGYTPEELLGRTPFDLMDDLEARRVGDLFVGIAESKKPFSAMENTNRHKDGHLVVLETSGMPVLDPNGNLLGYRGMDRDITSAKRMEAQFLQAQKLEAVGQLAGGVAHDFNNIIAAMMMQLSLLRDLPSIDKETRELLDELIREARRGANVTRQLLMFSRRSVLEIHPVDLNDVIRGLLKMLTRLVGEHISLRQEAYPNLPWIDADVGMLEQVLMNLVVNARDSMPRGGQIAIRTSVAEFSETDAEARLERRPGQFICVEVSDTGCGMDAETMKRVFEPFFTTKQPGQGTGLGLATVHGIVAQHKGWIEVDSCPGNGSTFRFFLPPRPAPAAVAEETEQEPKVPRGTETILLVEDDMILRRRVAALLVTLGYRVYEAPSPKEVDQIWETHGTSIQLLLTDMVMPGGVTGLELAERLHTLKPSLKVILSSGYSPEIVRSGKPTRPGFLFLPKPYEAVLLATSIRHLLDQESPS